MDQSNRQRRNDLDIDSFRSDEPAFDRARMRRQSGGFVDLGNESQYGTGGHQASGANEIFADIQVNAVSFYTLNLNALSTISYTTLKSNTLSVIYLLKIF